MKTIAEINAKVENLKRTMAKAEVQMAEKQSQIENLKIANSRSVELSLGKERRPASLALQRKKIIDLNSEIEELKFVQGRLDKELEQAKQNLHETSIRHRLTEYAKAEAYQLSLIQKAQDLLSQYVNAISELEDCRNAIELLVRINGDLQNGKRLVDFDFDLAEVLTKFSRAILSFNFDPSRIDNLNAVNRSFLNQLEAVSKGRRSFVMAKVQKGPTVQRMPYVDPLRQARLYEKHRLDSKDALSKALKGKTQIIQHNHR